MKSVASRLLLGTLSALLLCALAAADARGPAPQFSAQSLDGETFTNASLRGRVTLLQFWATWCPYCRRDQPALDNIEREFSGKGVMVLAIDVGESEAKVRQYLEANPRSCRVLLSGTSNLAHQFGANGFPYYVLIDDQGNITGSQSGAGGEASLRHLLSRAGVTQTPDTPHSAPPQTTIARSSIVEVPSSFAPSKPETRKATPRQKTIFVLLNGERFESDQYTLDATSLHVAVAGEQRTIALTQLDRKTTVAVNHQRGIDLHFPQSRSEIYVAF